MVKSVLEWKPVTCEGCGKEGLFASRSRFEFLLVHDVDGLWKAFQYNDSVDSWFIVHVSPKREECERYCEEIVSGLRKSYE